MAAFPHKNYPEQYTDKRRKDFPRQFPRHPGAYTHPGPFDNLNHSPGTRDWDGHANMCYRKLFIHHRCGHKITELTETCGDVECRTVLDTPVISNKYTCIIMSCMYYGHF
ncbi:hypothetical protein B0T25DRAFT_571719 [Lasiosphaeria hispida]|uniref:Uncharacterized protein n=1 Tax=Lasiosphaeria hispida TaxID=260671 RepID=A0AAJ0HC34_9PEZI|nr:hypothetical protein B0T25DRAFT_571719 [Lasiosphaeria hispida]